MKLATGRVHRKNAAVALDDTNHGEGQRERKRASARETGLRDSIILFVARRECGGGVD